MPQSTKKWHAHPWKFIQVINIIATFWTVLYVHISHQMLMVVRMYHLPCWQTWMNAIEFDGPVSWNWLKSVGVEASSKAIITGWVYKETRKYHLFLSNHIFQHYQLDLVLGCRQFCCWTCTPLDIYYDDMYSAYPSLANMATVWEIQIPGRMGKDSSGFYRNKTCVKFTCWCASLWTKLCITMAV